MARERIVSGESQSPEEEAYVLSLRPRNLREVVGQEIVKERIEIAVAAARQRNEAIEHILFDGPPGLGKTTLANVIAEEMACRSLRVTSGPALVRQADLMPILTNLEKGDIVFIDEIHRLPRIIEEFLYTAMEDFRVDVTIEGGVGGRIASFPLQPFTLIGATTRAGMLSGAMRDRFGLHFHLEYYTAAELGVILERSALRMKLDAEVNALEIIAGRSRGTPRIANRLLRRVRDYAQVRADGRLTPKVVESALEIQQVDRSGLDSLDRAFLGALIRIYDGGPAGIEAIAATMGQERDTLEDVVEPYLLQIGYIVRTRQGRMATKDAYAHLGVPYRGPADGPAVDPEDPNLFE